MVSYALKQAPEIILEVPGRDSRKQRQQALDQLIDKVNEDEDLRTKLADGAGHDDLIVVTEQVPALTHEPNNTVEEVKTLVQAIVSFGVMRVKLEQDRQEAKSVLKDLEAIFDPAVDLSEEQVGDLKKKSRLLISYAETKASFNEVKTNAQQSQTKLQTILELERNAEL
ncbi:MAG: hypothetical protein KME07_04845 [Pegethrix bostrychoides GSE-TBD4-15B]|jgi:uncharacterized protein YgfB (UPF0149 family)|uniref:Uncharacterized protein n=1 Tax=Pegethrix bostrychoides GSE-TBD4-15B TaxID=2839662 RepID=A0A951P830_9CYAN|nr:hypothetical protein [Pegethrix bostrychoides GSE-TBD4-15B]